MVVDVATAGIAPHEDVRTFVLTQLAFWLLAAIDGHAKNFSLFLRRDGYTLTPLYDVLSAWPIIGHGPNMLPIQKAKLEMPGRTDRGGVLRNGGARGERADRYREGTCHSPCGYSGVRPVAILLIQTLREVYGVRTTAMLDYHAFNNMLGDFGFSDMPIGRRDSVEG